MHDPDRLTLFTYLSSVYETFLNLEAVPLEAATPTAKKSKLTRKLSRKNSKSLLSSSPADSWGTNTNSLRRSLFPQKKEQQSKKEKKGKQEVIQEKDERTTSPPPPNAAKGKVAPANNVKPNTVKQQQQVTPRPPPNATKKVRHAI